MDTLSNDQTTHLVLKHQNAEQSISTKVVLCFIFFLSFNLLIPCVLAAFTNAHFVQSSVFFTETPVHFTFIAAGIVGLYYTQLAVAWLWIRAHVCSTTNRIFADFAASHVIAISICAGRILSSTTWYQEIGGAILVCILLTLLYYLQGALLALLIHLLRLQTGLLEPLKISKLTWIPLCGLFVLLILTIAELCFIAYPLLSIIAFLRMQVVIMLLLLCILLLCSAIFVAVLFGMTQRQLPTRFLFLLLILPALCTLLVLGVVNTSGEVVPSDELISALVTIWTFALGTGITLPFLFSREAIGAPESVNSDDLLR